MRKLLAGRKRKTARKSTGAVLLIGTAENSPDLVYASGFRAPDPVVFLRAGRKRMMVVPELELGRAARSSPGTSVRSPAELGLAVSRRRSLAAWAVALAREAGVRAVLVPPTFPHGVARDLERAGIRVRPAQGAIFPGRAVKSAHECDCIGEAQRAAVAAMAAARRLLSVSQPDRAGVLRHGGSVVTSQCVSREIGRVLLAHDCFCADTIVAGGVQGADPHERGHGPLRAGEPIVIDIFPRHLRHGYWGDLTRTLARGAVPPRVRRMYSAVRAARAAALAQVRAGVKCATVHAAAATELARRGFCTGRVNGHPAGFIHSTGHGVGLAVHEAPSVGPIDTRLRRGNVITIEPGLYYPDVGGVRIEDTVLVTPTGYSRFARCSDRMAV